MFNILLSVIFFTRFGQALTALLLSSKSLTTGAIIFQVCTPLFYATPACFYLYVTCFISNRKYLYKKEWLHFLPALLAIIHVLPWPSLPAVDWVILAKQLAEYGYFSLEVKRGLFPPYFQYIFRPVLIIVYLVLSWIKLFGLKEEERKKIIEYNCDWILFFLKIVTVFQTISLLPILGRQLHWHYSHVFFMGLNCLLLLLLFAYAIHKPHIFYGHLLVSVDWNKQTGSSLPDAIAIDAATETGTFQLTETLPAKSSRKINLSIQQGEIYACLLRDVMKDEAVYLNPDLQIIDLASRLNIPMHHCSFVLNTIIGKNFRDWINSYRIAYFLKQYPIKGNKITIEAIARESGFKSLATFYNAFKKEKGLMPKVYFNEDSNTDSIDAAQQL